MAGEPAAGERSSAVTVRGVFLRPTHWLPEVYALYERLAKRVASDGPHDAALFASTLACGPAGKYLWDSASGGLARRLILGLAAWLAMAIGAAFFLSFGFVLAIILLPLGRPARWLWGRLGFEPRPLPELPRKLSFEFGWLDLASLALIAFVFISIVSNRDKLLHAEMESDPDYHMAVARQIIDQGRVPEWDYWEYAPFGRPHLYPPGLHLAIAFFSGSADRIRHGFNTIQILLYPAALAAGWWFARWLLGPAGGFAALVAMAMELSFLFSQIAALPSAVVTAVMPLTLMLFLAGGASGGAALVVLLTASLYTHMGVPVFIMLGLLLVALRHRELYPWFRRVAAFAGVLYMPWLCRMIEHASWLGTSTGSMNPKGVVEYLLRGLLQLQMVNPVLYGFALWALWRTRRDARLGPVRNMLLAFTPMLFSYGGRFWMHTWPFWAVLAGAVAGPWLERLGNALEEGVAARSIRRRSLALVCVSILPLPVLQIGMGDGVTVIPASPEPTPRCLRELCRPGGRMRTSP